jgi:hypothetical protein
VFKGGELIIDLLDVGFVNGGKGVGGGAEIH